MSFNWFPSLEELAADPSYVDAPTVSVQSDDFNAIPGSVTNDLVTNGYAVKPAYSAEDLTNTVNNGVFTQGKDQESHEGQVLTVTTKWPATVTIPDGGHVLAMGLVDDDLKLIEDAGYQLHTTVESFVQSIRGK